jgi:CheY-like chemotaxis protein
VTRLVDIGIESYKIAAAVKGVIAQRLLRKLCTTCREPLDEEPPEKMRRWIPAGTQLYKAVGCPTCAMTGYRGRFAITEVLQVNLETERRIAANESMERIAEAAREGGMKSLWESGVFHVRRGETAIEELIRVLEVPSETGGRQSGARSAVTMASSASVAAPLAPPSNPRSTPTKPLHAVLQGDAFSLLDDQQKLHAATLAGQRVLLVEDEENLRRLLRDVLERSGFVVSEAGDGIEALEQIDRSAPDIVVLDLDLPKLDGYGVLRRLRSRRETAALPVLVLTAKGDEDSEVLVFEFGATEYISKPLRPRALSARIRSILKRP